MWDIVGRQIMTRKIFNSIFLVAIAVVISSLTIITGVLYNYFGSTQEIQLKDELNLLAKSTEHFGKSYLDELDFHRYRITWVNSDGRVIFDNQFDANSMENHKEREEIKEALTSGRGHSSRYSTTLTKNTIYEAIRLSDGSVIRISVSRATSIALVFSMLQPIIIILLIATILSAYLANKMAKRIVEPFNSLNLEKPMENDTYEELSPLLYHIYSQHEEINYQIKMLKQSKDEFNQITNNMKEALLLLDSAGRVVSINSAAKILFNVNSSCIGEDFLTIDRQQEMQIALEKATQEGHADFRMAKNSRVYQFDISRIDSDNKKQGMVILAFDITDQVNAEKNRKEFTANVSHELKTPLQSIIGSAELIENGVVKNEDIPRFIKRIHKESSRLIFLIDDIIRLSQLDEGLEMPKEEVSLKKLTKEVIETLDDMVKLKEVSFEVVGDEGIIYGVKRLLYEMVYNLCDNAIKYNNQGGCIKISIKNEENFLKFTIKDTGIGIASENHNKIFERFYRVDKSHSKSSGGTGLGLSIVKNVVLYHHGKLSIESEINKGTTIFITFDMKNLK